MIYIAILLTLGFLVAFGALAVSEMLKATPSAPCPAPVREPKDLDVPPRYDDGQIK